MNRSVWWTCVLTALLTTACDDASSAFKRYAKDTPADEAATVTYWRAKASHVDKDEKSLPPENRRALAKRCEHEAERRARKLLRLPDTQPIQWTEKMQADLEVSAFSHKYLPNMERALERLEEEVVASKNRLAKMEKLLQRHNISADNDKDILEARGNIAKLQASRDELARVRLDTFIKYHKLLTLRTTADKEQEIAGLIKAAQQAAKKTLTAFESLANDPPKK